MASIMGAMNVISGGILSAALAGAKGYSDYKEQKDEVGEAAAKATTNNDNDKPKVQKQTKPDFSYYGMASKAIENSANEIMSKYNAMLLSKYRFESLRTKHIEERNLR